MEVSRAYLSFIIYHLAKREITRTTPNPSFMKGGDYEMDIFSILI